jgi:hypothetical protein
LPSNATATSIANQPAITLPAALQGCASTLETFQEDTKDAIAKQPAKVISPMPIQSGKNPGPGPTSEA